METYARFSDGAAYERMMGTWSRLVGDIFIDWLAPARGLRWIDVGCGNGAFTALLGERCAPASLDAIDASEAQIAFAKSRPVARLARFQRGDAMALPFADDSFDAAVMALVIFFVPEPAKGVAEMARVVRPGGSVAAYAWDMFDGGFPLDVFRVEFAAMGITMPLPPSADACRTDALRRLWAGQGIEPIETREIRVRRTFPDFEDFWAISTGANIGQLIARMDADAVTELRARIRARLPADASGRISYEAWANAIKGRTPR